MNLNDADLQRLYQNEKRPTEPCVTDDLLLRAASNDVTANERDIVSGHVAECRRCAAYFQIAFAMLPLRLASTADHRRELPWAAIIAFALFASAFVIGGVQYRRQQLTVARLQRQLVSVRATVAQLQGRPPVSAPRSDASAPRAERSASVGIDTPIVDIDPDPERGEAPAAVEVAVPASSDQFVLLLHLPEALSGSIPISIEKANGTVVHYERWQPAGSAALVTLTLSRKNFDRGDYRVKIGRTAFAFRVNPQPR